MLVSVGTLRQTLSSFSDWKLSRRFPAPGSCLFVFPSAPIIISLCSYVIIGLGKEFQGCRLSEQHYAELSSRVISDANTCPRGDGELSCDSQSN